MCFREYHPIQRPPSPMRMPVTGGIHAGASMILAASQENGAEIMRSSAAATSMKGGSRSKVRTEPGRVSAIGWLVAMQHLAFDHTACAQVTGTGRRPFHRPECRNQNAITGGDVY